MTRDEDASVGQGGGRRDERGGVQGPVGGDEPPLVEEPARLKCPLRDRQLVVEAAILDDARQ
jgi:hypothetical protein